MAYVALISLSLSAKNSIKSTEEQCQGCSSPKGKQGSRVSITAFINPFQYQSVINTQLLLT